MYDVTSRTSFEALRKWMVEVDRHAPAEVAKLVVGTKADVTAQPSVSEEEAAAFASKHGALCERCSAKDGTNVQRLFERLAEKLVHNGFDPEGRRRGAQQTGGLRVSSGGKKKKKGGCC